MSLTVINSQQCGHLGHCDSATLCSEGGSSEFLKCKWSGQSRALGFAGHQSPCTWPCWIFRVARKPTCFGSVGGKNGFPSFLVVGVHGLQQHNIQWMGQAWCLVEHGTTMVEHKNNWWKQIILLFNKGFILKNTSYFLGSNMWFWVAFRWQIFSPLERFKNCRHWDFLDGPVI